MSHDSYLRTLICTILKGSSESDVFNNLNRFVQLGWSLNLCTDEDECRNAPCNDEQDCINTAGSYKCVQKGIRQNLKSIRPREMFLLRESVKLVKHYINF